MKRLLFIVDGEFRSYESDPLDRPIKDFARDGIEIYFSTRSWNCLNYAHILTIRELVQMTEYELLKLKNFGRGSVANVKEVLAARGLSLGMKREMPFTQLGKSALSPIGMLVKNTTDGEQAAYEFGRQEKAEEILEALTREFFGEKK
jgi:hypothetical protein